MNGVMCEFCDATEDLIVFPTKSGNHKLCLACAAGVAHEALRWLPNGGEGQN